MLGTAPVYAAEPEAVQSELRYDLPAQPLGSALLSLGVQSGISIAFTEDQFANLTAPPLSGSYTVSEALSRVLAGSGFTYVFLDARSVKIVRTAPEPPKATPIPAPVPPQGRLDPNPKEEVVVTARRREERVQSVPIAITVFSQQTLRQNAIETINDLQYLVPAMSISQMGYISIRGISGLASDAQGVISYLNEIPLAGNPDGAVSGGIGPGLYYDMQNVQVLEGPQGTLFGRNTIGGAIVYETKRPTDHFEEYLEGTLGNYADREVTGALNVPIVPNTVLFRAAINSATRDGYTRVLATGSDPGGTDLDDENFFAGRVSITFRPADRLQDDFIFDAIETKTNGTSNILASVDPKSDVVAGLYPGLVADFRRQQALGIRSELPTGAPARVDSTFHSFTDIFRFDITDEIAFRNIANYTGYYTKLLNDGDGTTLPILDRVAEPVRRGVESYSEEPQLQGKSFDGDLVWTAGAFYLHKPALRYSRIVSVSFSTPAIGDGSAAESSRALYAQGTYDLSRWIEGLKFTGGYRYTWDSKYASNRNLDGNGTCGDLPLSKCTLTGYAKSHAPGWTVGLDYQLTPTAMIYAASRRGYHSGGVNLGLVDADNQFYRPEYLTDEEVGVKSELAIAGMKARIDGALYHQDYSDIQTVHFVKDAGQLSAVLGNAASAENWGMELDSRFYPTNDLELGFQFNLFNFRYTGFGPGVDSVALKNSVLLNGPHSKIAADARYHLPLDSRVGDISLSARWVWQSKQIVSPAIDQQVSALSYQNPFGLLTLSASWDHIYGSAFDASFFMTNALDKTYKDYGLFLPAELGFQNVSYGPPRLFGFRLHYSFGQHQ